MELTPNQLMILLLGDHSNPVAEWTSKGDLIIGVYPKGETYEQLRDNLTHERLMKDA